MSKSTREFLIDLPIAGAASVCRHAIATARWRVTSVEAHRIVTKIGLDAGIGRNPSTIEILLDEGVDDARTTVTLHGSIFGLGPIQAKHLNRQLNWLHDAMEVAAVASAAPLPDTASARDPMEQLRALGELHASGFLTDADFAAKKAELLQRI